MCAELSGVETSGAAAPATQANAPSANATRDWRTIVCGFIMVASLGLQVSIEKLHRRLVGLVPRAVQQEAVRFVGEDELLERHLVRAQAVGQVHGLVEAHVVVVVALDE